MLVVVELVLIGLVTVIGAFVICRRGEYVEVPVEVDVSLAAVVSCDLDLVVALFVFDLRLGNGAAVGVVECDALRLVDVVSGGLRRGVAAGSISHACPDEQQHSDRRRYQPRLYVYCSRVHSFTSFCPTLLLSVGREPESSMRSSTGHPSRWGLL